MKLMDLYPVIPLIIIAAAPVIIMLSAAIKRNHAAASALALLSLTASLVFIYKFYNTNLTSESSLLIIDKFGLFFLGLFIIATAAVVVISYQYIEAREGRKEEYYILLMMALLGAAVLAVSRHFISLFLGLEILSISLYSLISYSRDNKKALEAGIKYLVLAASSSAFFLFGTALVYFESGTMDFLLLSGITAKIGSPVLFTAGIGFVIIGVGFKLAIVPFHMWIPDVYEGAPAPVAAFIASVSKGAVLAVLIRFFNVAGSSGYESIITIFSVTAIASMTAGNLMALLQKNVKRILAYSSISHFGYLLVAFIAGGRFGTEAAAFYMTAYFFTIIGAFGIITLQSDKNYEPGELKDFNGLFWKRPWLSVSFTLILLSLAGIPLTAGFIGKFYVAAAGIGSSLWLLVLVLAINSVIGMYYYLRMISYFYSAAGNGIVTNRLSAASAVFMIIITFTLLWMGIFPSAIINMIEKMV